MRTIKFKGQQLSNGDWIVGDLIHLVDGVYISNDNGNNKAQVNPDTVCQFTGFTDKNGREIYEGDVLRSDHCPFSCLEDNECDNYYAVVCYCEENASFYTITVKNPDSDVRGFSDGIPDSIYRGKMKIFEVVGNIHEPEWTQYAKYF